MTIKLNAATGGGSVSLSAPNSTTSNLDVDLTLPVDDGAANTFLRSDGSGTLSWAAASSDSITEGNTTVECVDTGSNGHITFDTEGTEAARFDSSQRLLVGTTTALGRVDIAYGGYQTSATPALVIGADIGNTTSRSNNTRKMGLISCPHYDNGTDIAMMRCDSVSTVTQLQLGGTDEKRGATLISFYTASSTTATPAERASIDNTGTLVFPNTSGNWNIDSERPSGAGQGHVRFVNGTTQVGTITTSTTATAYNTSSDYRLKENVVPLTGAADRLNQLQVHRFNFIADPDTTVDGFIAHEAQVVVPEAVTGTQDEVEVWKEHEELPNGVSVGDNKLDEDGNTIPVYQGIDQSKLVPLLTAALQETLAKIETLETANASLEARLTALEGGAS